MGEQKGEENGQQEPGKMTMTMHSALEIELTRAFDAPRDLVCKVMTDPQLIPRWWGRRGSTTTVDRMDVKPGGKWRFVQVTPEGSEYAFNGEYREILPPQRIVQTFEFEGMPGHVSIETGVLKENNGTSTFTAGSRFDSIDERDGMLNSGMEEGAAEMYDRLELLLAELS